MIKCPSNLVQGRTEDLAAAVSTEVLPMDRPGFAFVLTVAVRSAGSSLGPCAALHPLSVLGDMSLSKGVREPQWPQKLERI